MTPEELIAAVADWARSDPRIEAAALCGSYARGDARPDSDIDFALVCANPNELLRNRTWIEQFGTGREGEAEDYNLVRSIRVYYDDGPEVEFGITSRAWTEPPIDEGTARVMREGLKILYDPEDRLTRALSACLKPGNYR